MRRLIIILFALISLSVHSATYYVSTTGSDAAAGSLAAPWASWQKAFNTVQAGDTAYFRGGIWYPTTPLTGVNAHTTGHDGTLEEPLCFFAYPADVASGNPPILDLSLCHQTGDYITAFYIVNTNYIKVKGLTVRNVYQRRDYVLALGFYTYASSNFTFENCTAYNVSGTGFLSYGGFGLPGYDDVDADTSYFINCDSYNMCDSFRLPGGAGTLGGYADGFKADNEPGAVIIFEGCRGWNANDDAYDMSGSAYFKFNNCWGFLTGRSGGVGNGIKTGFFRTDVPELTVRVTNCLAVFNKYSGFQSMNSSGGAYHFQRVSHYNNTAYKNEYGFQVGKNGAGGELKTMIFRNNIAYANRTLNWQSSYLTYVESNNTWDGNGSYPGGTTASDVTVTDADFLTVDSLTAISQLTGSRKSDYSLPDITFLRLAAGSDLIDAGIVPPPTDTIDFTMNYEGDHPDMGFDEWVDAPDSTATDIITFTLASQKGLATINTTLHTVAISVVNGTNVTALQPTITLDYGATVSPTSGTATNFTNPVNYTVTALNGSTTQVWAVTVTESDPDVPTLSTTSASTIKSIQALLGGNVISEGNATVTARGIVWGVSESPTLSNNVVTVSGTTGSFTTTLTGLNSNTTYHVRSYATNSAGTSYGADISFTTDKYTSVKSGGKDIYYNRKQIIIK